MVGMGIVIMTGRVATRVPNRVQRREEMEKVSYPLSDTDGQAEDSRTKGVRQ